MSVLELYHNGVIAHLTKHGFVSSSIPVYIEYFIKFSEYRKAGKSYRDSVMLLSQENRVSTTTIKKGIRLIKNFLR